MKYLGEKILLLQGPMGPFFWWLARKLRRRGATIYKINFNLGDLLFYPFKNTLYRKPFKDFSLYLEKFLQERNIQQIVLFGDCRPYHRVAVEVAKRLGVRILDRKTLWLTCLLVSTIGDQRTCFPCNVFDSRHAARLADFPNRRSNTVTSSLVRVMAMATLVVVGWATTAAAADFTVKESPNKHIDVAYDGRALLRLMTANDTETGEAAYLEVIRSKTAALFAAAARIGAVVAERPQVEEDALDTYGLNLGIAFQLIDDVLDFSAKQATLGKAVGDDFREGKITLPVILAFRRGNDEERDFWRRTLERVEQGDADLHYRQA